ncbi:MAG TPA: DUF255 domain-containing protein, partial [Thermoanaerobaculia bacterium]|nr:DUF255 domain-containing protein [Thermoanaerobaculia bacterium]
MLRRALVLSLLILSGSALFGAESRLVSDQQGAPIRWSGWSDAVLARAKKEQKPLFVFVAAFGSHDTRQMLREAFLNGEVAEMMNAYFVPVILDARTRPDLARMYGAIAATTDLPLNLILTPEGKPFVSFGYTGTAELSRQLVIQANRWKDERAAVLAEAEQKVKTVAPATTHEIPLRASALLAQLRGGDRDAAVDALHKLAASALYDQLGGGFHRAANDAERREPMYEKTLADQALLATAYLEAWQITHDDAFLRVARATLDFVLRDLRAPNSGPFDAGEEADSLVPGEGPVFATGAFYTWDAAELERLLGDEAADKVIRLYGIERGARHALALHQPQLLGEATPSLQKMLEIRQKRPSPFRDDQALAGDNALMISALARAAAVLRDETYLRGALSAATYLTTKLWNAQTKTLARAPGVVALPEDYTFAVQAMLDLFDATYDVRWLDLALAMQTRL